jgi:hypothetical protein
VMPIRAGASWTNLRRRKCTSNMELRYATHPPPCEERMGQVVNRAGEALT